MKRLAPVISIALLFALSATSCRSREILFEKRLTDGTRIYLARTSSTEERIGNIVPGVGSTPREVRLGGPHRVERYTLYARESLFSREIVWTISVADSVALIRSAGYRSTVDLWDVHLGPGEVLYSLFTAHARTNVGESRRRADGTWAPLEETTLRREFQGEQTTRGEFTTNGDLRAAIEIVDGRVMEWDRTPTGWTPHSP